MRNIYKIIRAELHLVLDNHSILLTVLIAPLLYALLLGTIYMQKDIERISFAVVDNDNTATTLELTRLLAASPKIGLVTRTARYGEAKELLLRQKITGFLWFPRGFEKKLLKLQGAEVQVYLNTTRFLPSNDLNKAVNLVMMTVGSGVRLRYFELHGLNPRHAMELINPVIPEIRPVYNPTNNYGDFLLPGLLFLILQQTLLIGMGESVAVDNEEEKLPEYLQEKGGVLAYMLGKPAYYMFLYFAYYLIFFWGIYPLLGVQRGGDMPAMLTVGMIFVMSIAMLAVFTGSFIKSQVRYMAILAFSTYPFFLISGYSWPVTAMPLPLQWLAQAVPTTHFLHAGIRLVVMGGSWEDVAPDILKLLLLLGVFTLLTAWRLLYIRHHGEKGRKML